MSDAGQLLAEYAKTHSEEAFREVVTRYLNLVYSTALRLVNGDAHSAEDVTQRVFADLAKMAESLSQDVLLGGWLHRHTCFIASKTLRGERRRIAREQQAVTMNDLQEPSDTNVAALTPVLDEAINHLGSTDRQAVLLRFFEQKDFRAVGEALGSNEEAARKRVNRALDKLRGLLKRRGVALSAGALASALSSQAISAAPAGLAAGVTTAALASVAAGGGTALTILQIMSMTKLQGGIIAAVAIGLSIPLVMQQRTARQLHAENAALRAEAAQVAALSSENQRLSNLLAQSRQPVAPTDKDQAREVLKLRGQVGSLRKTADEALAAVAKASEAPLSGVTANPEMHKMLREQQKMSLSMIYKGFANHSKLPGEKIEALNDLLADSVMTNINHITAILRDGSSVEERERILRQQEIETNAQVKELIGPEAYKQFEEYNRHLGSYLTAEQFKSMMLTGDKPSKDAQAKQLYELMREETRKMLAAQGLRDDYQTVPTLNFRNFTSEEDSERGIQLLDSIYDQVQARAEFLGPQGLAKFEEFRKLAINNNRVALAVNRKLMAPPTK